MYFNELFNAESFRGQTPMGHTLNEEVTNDFSPFRRSYTKGGIGASQGGGGGSVKHFDLSSPLSMLRRSCPQSPRVPINQNAVKPGKTQIF